MRGRRRDRRVDGDKLRHIREDRFLTQEDVAKKAGITKNTVHRIEAGKSPWPGFTTIRSIARALEVNPNEFMEERPS
jgi:transcriptional regulator with XRE-family HTH domain